MGGSDSTSPLITVGLILAVPLLNRYLRSNQAPTSTTSASPSSLRRPWYSPRLFSLRMSRLVSLHPSEYLLLALFVTLATYHLAALNPLGQSYRASRDLFLHTGLPIGASSASLRGRVAALGVEEVGLSGWMNTGEIGGMGEDGGMESAAGAAAGGDVLERLLRRLNSMSSRQSYLLLGPAPLLSCSYCTHPSDHQLYALPPILLLYALHALAFGLSTAAPTTLRSLDSLRSASASTVVSSAHWRSTLAALLPIMAVLEISVVFDWYGWSEDQRSPWNHWHANVYLARHCLLLLLSILVYLYPRAVQAPGPGAPPAPARIAQRLALLGDCVTKTSSNVSLLDVGREVTWRDAELRGAVQEWHEGQARLAGEEGNRGAGAMMRLREAQDKGWIQRPPEQALVTTKEHVWRRIDEVKGEGERIAATSGEQKS